MIMHFSLIPYSAERVLDTVETAIAKSQSSSFCERHFTTLTYITQAIFFSLFNAFFYFIKISYHLGKDLLFKDPTKFVLHLAKDIIQSLQSLVFTLIGLLALPFIFLFPKILNHFITPVKVPIHPLLLPPPIELERANVAIQTALLTLESLQASQIRMEEELSATQSSIQQLHRDKKALTEKLSDAQAELQRYKESKTDAMTQTSPLPTYVDHEVQTSEQKDPLSEQIESLKMRILQLQQKLASSEDQIASQERHVRYFQQAQLETHQKLLETQQNLSILQQKSIPNGTSPTSSDAASTSSLPESPLQIAPNANYLKSKIPPHVQEAIRQLRENEQLSSLSFQLALQVLQTSENPIQTNLELLSSESTYTPDDFIHRLSTELKNIQKSPFPLSSLYVPFFIGNAGTVHTVLLVFNRKKGIIEYFDPRGSLAQQEKKTIPGLNILPQQFLEMCYKHPTIRKHISNSASNEAIHLLENATNYQHPQDTKNSEIYVLAHIEEQQGGVPIQSLPVNKRRQTLAEKIQSHSEKEQKETISTDASWLDNTSSFSIQRTGPSVLQRLWGEGNSFYKIEKYMVTLAHFARAFQPDELSSISQELNAVGSSTFVIHLQQCIKALTTPSCSDYSDARSRYQFFLHHLEQLSLELLKEPTHSPQKLKYQPLIQKLCHQRWAENCLSEYMNECTCINVRASEKEKGSPSSILNIPLSSQNLVSTVQTINSCIHSAPWYVRKPTPVLMTQKLMNQVGLGDHHENVPQIIASITYPNLPHPLIHLRHGTPHMPLSTWAATKQAAGYEIDVPVMPSYQIFLQKARETQKGVFYVIHQQLAPGSERNRVLSLLKLQEIYPNFYPLVQPMDGILFEKKEPYNGPQTLDDLRSAILYEYFDNNDQKHGFELPRILHAESRKTHYRNVCHQLFEQMRDVFFPDPKKPLSKEEWQSAILLFYQFQKIDLEIRLSQIGSFPIAYTVSACKDNIDRGGVSALLKFMFYLYWLGKFDDDVLLRNVVFNILGAPILVKKQALIPERLLLALNALTIIVDRLRNPDNLTLFQTTLTSLFGRPDLQFLSQDPQDLFPLTLVRTPNELLPLLQSLQKTDTISPLNMAVSSVEKALPLLENSILPCINMDGGAIVINNKPFRGNSVKDLLNALPLNTKTSFILLAIIEQSYVSAIEHMNALLRGNGSSDVTPCHYAKSFNSPTGRRKPFNFVVRTQSFSDFSMQGCVYAKLMGTSEALANDDKPFARIRNEIHYEYSKNAEGVIRFVIEEILPQE